MEARWRATGFVPPEPTYNQLTNQSTFSGTDIDIPALIMVPTGIIKHCGGIMFGSKKKEREAKNVEEFLKIAHEEGTMEEGVLIKDTPRKPKKKLPVFATVMVVVVLLLILGIATLFAKISALESEVASLKSQVQSAELASLKNQVATLEKNLQSFSRDKERLKDDVAQLEKAVENVKSQAARSATQQKTTTQPAKKKPATQPAQTPQKPQGAPVKPR
jgi:Skp family chaperone for outer membrane proteins